MQQNKHNAYEHLNNQLDYSAQSIVYKKNACNCALIVNYLGLHVHFWSFIVHYWVS